jgi:ubiquinone/menaquinone biosynthesis C-methylase UbiE
MSSNEPTEQRPRERENLHVHYSAESYDKYTEGFVEVYDEGMVKRLLKEGGARGGVLLDVGTGTARHLIKMAAVPALDSLRLVGVDYYQDMVDEALRAVALEGLQGRVEVLQADAHQLPFPDGFADFVISRSTIHHWADPARAFGEIYRVLKPGGVALIHDVRRDPAPDVLAQFNEQRRLAGVEPCRLEEKYTAAEVEAFLAATGLQQHATVGAPDEGPGALGFEVRIGK